MKPGLRWLEIVKIYRDRAWGWTGCIYTGITGMVWILVVALWPQVMDYYKR
jgi:hypothetical protein